MASTVTLLTDHLGSDKPKVMGIEYCVDATVEITDYAVAGEVINAVDLGLGTITQALICGYESAVVVPKILVDSDGTYTSDSSITILVQNPDGSDADAMALGVDGLTDLGMVRLRVWGTLA
tara:strand:- start:582 stop:944 length:363 start_codon:yes stop_codon:yes gene_type:complete